MGRTNLKFGLERKLSNALGELKAAQKEYDELRAGLLRLATLRKRIADLTRVVEAAETLLRDDHPNWNRDKIQPVRTGAWKSPFPSGEQGQLGLATLRAAGDWMRPRNVAKIMLEQIGWDPADSDTLHRVTSSIGIYFKKYEGALVESRGDFAKEWRVIRENR